MRNARINVPAKVTNFNNTDHVCILVQFGYLNSKHIHGLSANIYWLCNGRPLASVRYFHKTYMKKIFSPKNLLLVCLCCAISPCFSQRITNDTDTLIAKGLYLENFENWIPWDITFDSLYTMYKDKGITKCCLRKDRYGLVMHDVTIFNGIHVDSIWLFTQRPTSKVFYLNIFFTGEGADSAKNYLKTYTKKNGIIYSESLPTRNEFRCRINDCSIGVWTRAK